MAENLFNDLNLNPLIVVEDDNDAKNVQDQDIDTDTDEGSEHVDDKNKGKGTQRQEPLTIEVDDTDEDEDEIPLGERHDHEDDDSEVDSDGLKAWVTFYREKGLIAEDVKDEDITDTESLFEKLREQQLSTANVLLESYKAQLPKEVRDLVEAWEDGAEGEAFKKVMGLRAEQIEFEKLTPESIKGSVDTQKNVVRNYLKRTTKHSDDKIEKYIKRLEDMEELEEEAVANAEELKTLVETEQKSIRETAKAAEAKRVKDAQEQREDIVKFIKDTKAIIPDLNVTEGEKKEIENLIFSPVAKDANGNPVFYLQKLFSENPKEMAVKINYLAILTKGFTDYSKLFKKAETRVAKTVDKLLETKPPKSKTKNTKTEDDSWKENLRRIQR